MGDARKRRAWLAAESLAPRGWRDLWVQVGLFVGCGALYALSGIYGRYESATAISNARSVIRVEAAMGVGWERGIQGWALVHPGTVELGNRMYALSQFAVTNAFLLWAYVCRYRGYLRIRNALLAANLVSFIGLLVYPLAPPRMVPSSGFVDTLDSGSVTLHSSVIDALNNPYAAMPSLHAAYALVIGVAGVTLSRALWARTLWGVYPLLVLFSVVATGNHFVVDLVAGAASLLAAPIVDRAAPVLAKRGRSLRRPQSYSDGQSEQSPA